MTKSLTEDFYAYLVGAVVIVGLPMIMVATKLIAA